LDEIIDHATDNSAILIDYGYTTSAIGNRVPKQTTKGWKLLCQWRDGSSTWVPLVNLKESNPVELAEYAVANRLQEEPVFKWWVSLVLRKRKRIIGKIKSRYWSTLHKFGLQLPKSAAEAFRIDDETGTTFWMDAIWKEMEKVKVAFEFCESWTPQQVRDGTARGDFVSYQEIDCHMIFDIKMDLTRKARFVAGVHMTETPTSITYSSVVSRDSVRIAFLIAALNDLDIMACDISNTYLNAPCKEKIWFVAGPEFGSRQGQVKKRSLMHYMGSNPVAHHGGICYRRQLLKNSNFNRQLPIPMYIVIAIVSRMVKSIGNCCLFMSMTSLLYCMSHRNTWRSSEHSRQIDRLRILGSVITFLCTECCKEYQRDAMIGRWIKGTSKDSIHVRLPT
jgi:hypothetical protein